MDAGAVRLRSRRLIPVTSDGLGRYSARPRDCLLLLRPLLRPESSLASSTGHQQPFTWLGFGTPHRLLLRRGSDPPRHGCRRRLLTCGYSKGKGMCVLLLAAPLDDSDAIETRADPSEASRRPANPS